MYMYIHTSTDNWRVKSQLQIILAYFILLFLSQLTLQMILPPLKNIKPYCDVKLDFLCCLKNPKGYLKQ